MIKRTYAAILSWAENQLQLNGQEEDEVVQKENELTKKRLKYFDLLYIFFLFCMESLSYIYNIWEVALTNKRKLRNYRKIALSSEITTHNISIILHNWRERKKGKQNHLFSWSKWSGDCALEIHRLKFASSLVNNSPNQLIA